MKALIQSQFGAAIDMLENAMRACPDGLWADRFTLSEMEFDGRMPERAYTKAELQTYLEHGRAKWRGAMDALSDEHHAAQLNLILRQQTHSAPEWVARARA